MKRFYHAFTSGGRKQFVNKFNPDQVELVQNRRKSNQPVFEDILLEAPFGRSPNPDVVEEGNEKSSGMKQGKVRNRHKDKADNEDEDGDED